MHIYTPANHLCADSTTHICPEIPFNTRICRMCMFKTCVCGCGVNEHPYSLTSSRLWIVVTLQIITDGKMGHTLDPCRNRASPQRFVHPWMLPGCRTEKPLRSMTIILAEIYAWPTNNYHYQGQCFVEKFYPGHNSKLGNIRNKWSRNLEIHMLSYHHFPSKLPTLASSVSWVYEIYETKLGKLN